MGLAVVTHNHRVRNGVYAVGAVPAREVAADAGGGIRTVYRNRCLDDDPLAVGFCGRGDLGDGDWVGGGEKFSSYQGGVSDRVADFRPGAEASTVMASEADAVDWRMSRP